MTAKRADARPDNRSRALSFRVSANEFEDIRKAATKVGTGHTGLARALVLGGVAELLDDDQTLPPVVVRMAAPSKQFTPEALDAARELRLLRLELNRVGVNLNQAVRALNADSMNAETVSRVVAALKPVAEQVNESVRLLDAVHGAVFSAPEELR